jgi:hypothetical protein
MRLRPLSVLLLATLLAIVFPANKLNAQTTTSGGLTGVVTDPSYAVVPDAGVEIRDTAKGTVQSTKTERDGVYRFFFLTPSRYTLTVTHDGFRKLSQTVSVLLGPPGTVNVTLHYGVNIDHAYDHVTLRNILNQVFWDVGGGPIPSPIDTWVMANGIALVVGRVDGLEVNDFFLFMRYAGMLLTDSPDQSQNPTCGYGTGSDFDLDTVQYGIIVNASQSPGYKFTTTNIGSGAGGIAAVQVGAGSLPPKILINGGEQRGYWADGPYPPAGPDTIIVSILP